MHRLGEFVRESHQGIYPAIQAVEPGGRADRPLGQEVTALGFEQCPHC
jgi:hypothetical protein